MAKTIDLVTHTPGPWEFLKGDGCVVTQACDHGAQEIAWSDADYRLISAAPELLAAAKQVAADFDLQIHGGRAVNYMKHWQELVAAIAKAEGQ